MSRRYQYFKGNKDKKFNIASMRKYVARKQELDKALEKMIKSHIKGKSLDILDACCGIGHISYFLSDISPTSRFLGIDQTAYLIEAAKKLCKDTSNVSFEVGDLYDVAKKYRKKFDISINWKTLSWLPYYDDAMKALVRMTKKHIFISSLFYDGDIDFITQVRTFKLQSSKDGFNIYYNVYSFPRFKRFVKSLGARAIVAHDFEIPIDLPRGDINSTGTYTVKLQNGKRLQLSGAVVMYWKIIRIDL